MTSRITYNSINIDLESAWPGEDIEFIQERERNMSASGKSETINIYGINIYQILCRFSISVYYQLVGWWSWARKGKTFSFALDNTKTADTTLDSSASSGQKTIPLSNTSGFSADDVCLIRSSDGDDFEIVEIDSVSAGVSVTAKSNLINGYSSGDIFRHKDYWPSVFSDNDSFKPLRLGASGEDSRLFYSFVFEFKEKL